MPVIGLLYGVSAAEWAHRIAAMRRGLGEMGFVEGRNVAIDYRWAAGQFDRLPGMAADLVSRNVAVIICGGGDLATRAAMAATQTIPIVFTTAGNPVQLGFVASLNRPGGNATGITTFGRELGPKRLELLRELLPTAGKIALLVNPNQPAVSQAEIQSAQTAARRPRAGDHRCQRRHRERNRKRLRSCCPTGGCRSPSLLPMRSLPAGTNSLPRWVCAMRYPRSPMTVSLSGPGS